MTQYKSFAYNKQYKRENDIPCVFILYFIYIKAPKLSSFCRTPSAVSLWPASGFVSLPGSLTHSRISRSRALSLPANNLPSRKSTRCSSLHTDRSKEVRGPEIPDFPYGKFRTNSGFFQNYRSGLRSHLIRVPIRTPDDSSSNASFFVPDRFRFRRKIFFVKIKNV